MAYTEHQWNRLVSSKEDKGLGTVATTRDRRNTRTQFLSEEWRRKSSPNNSSSEFLEYLEQHVRFQIWANGNHLARYPHHHQVTHRSKTILPWRLWQSGRPLRISTKPNSPSSQQILLSIMWALPEIRERAKWNCLQGAVDVQVLILLPASKVIGLWTMLVAALFNGQRTGLGQPVLASLYRLLYYLSLKPFEYKTWGGGPLWILDLWLQVYFP